MSNQPFTIPKPNITQAQINRPGPGARLPGPLAGTRPGMPKPGVPNPMGIPKQIPPNMTAPTQQTQSNPPQEEQKTHLEPKQPEIKKPEPVPEQTQPGKIGKEQAPPQLGRVPMGNPPGKTAPSFQPPTQIAKKPVLEEDPKRIPAKQEPVKKENYAEQPTDQFMRLSESLQAMKNLRSNFQGFGEDEEGNDEEEEEQNQNDYEDDDDYVKVDENEGLDEQDDVLVDDSQNQYEQYDQEENQEEVDPESYEREEEPQYEEEAYEEKEPEYIEPKIEEPPAQTKPVFHHHHHNLHPHKPQNLGQSQTTQPFSKEIPQAQTQAQVKRDSLPRETPKVVHHEPVVESEEEDIVQHEPEVVRSDPELLLKYERLQLELEREKKKSAHLEQEQERLVHENTGLKHKNSELTAKIEALNRKIEQGSSQSHQELEALKAEFERSITETKQIYETASQSLLQANKFNEETEAIVVQLTEERNNLYGQVQELRREIDEDYLQKIEGFRQKAELLETKIRDQEATFQLVQEQLNEKNQTFQRIASLNSEIQTAISHVSKAPGSTQSTVAKPKPAIKEIVITRPVIESQPKVEKKTLDLPRSQPETQRAKEEPRSIPGSRKESTSVKAPEDISQPKPFQTPGPLNQETAVNDVNQKAHPSTTLPQQTQPVRQVHPSTQTGNVTQESLTQPPAYKMPQKKKEEVPKKPGFRPLAGNALFGDDAGETQMQEEKKEVAPPVTQPKETHAPISKPGGFVPTKSKVQKMDAKGLFDESEGAGSFFNYSSTNQATSKPPQKLRYSQEEQEEHHEGVGVEGYEEAQQEEADVYHAQPQNQFGGKQQNTFGGQNKTNLRYSQNLPVEKEQAGISVEAAENFFDQLGQGNQPTSFPPVQSQPQSQTTVKSVHQTPVQRGRNPFAEESQPETNESTDFFSNAGAQNDSFVNRPGVQNTTQARPVIGHVQTGMPKKIEVNKGSALKKMKGNIPSSMFD